MGRYSQQLSRAARRPRRRSAGQRVLDVGCGPGALTAELVARVGADAVSRGRPVGGVRRGRARRDIRASTSRRAPAEELPFADGAFDAALAQLVVHFMADPVRACARWRASTRAGRRRRRVRLGPRGREGPLSLFWQRRARARSRRRTTSRAWPGAREGHLGELFAERRASSEVEEAALEVSRVEYASFDEWWEPFTLGVGLCRRLLPREPLDERGARRSCAYQCREAGSLPRRSPITTAAWWPARGESLMTLQQLSRVYGDEDLACLRRPRSEPRPGKARTRSTRSRATYLSRRLAGARCRVPRRGAPDPPGRAIRPDGRRGRSGRGTHRARAGGDRTPAARRRSRRGAGPAPAPAPLPGRVISISSGAATSSPRCEDLDGALREVAPGAQPRGHMLVYTTFRTDLLSPQEAELFDRHLGNVARQHDRGERRSCLSACGASRRAQGPDRDGMARARRGAAQPHVAIDAQALALAAAGGGTGRALRPGHLRQHRGEPCTGRSSSSLASCCPSCMS